LPHLAVPTPTAAAEQNCEIILGTFLRRGFAINGCQLYSSFLNIPTSLLYLLIQEKNNWDLRTNLTAVLLNFQPKQPLVLFQFYL
jgi:hypothetical protein